MASSAPAGVVFFLVVLSLLSAYASARPGLPFNTVFVSYTVTTTASSDDALPGLHRTSVFVSVYRIIAPVRTFHPDPHPARIARPALLPRRETRIASRKRIPSHRSYRTARVRIHPSSPLSCPRASESELMSSVGNGDGCCAGGSDGGQRHVLAVDDSSVDRAVIAGILRSSKLRVTAVDSGKRALELLGLKKDVSMIITDYWMPEMTGYELLKRVKESSELKEIPVVIMSSENVPNRITRCLEEGAEEFLLKPIRPSDVSRICSHDVVAHCVLIERDNRISNDTFLRFGGTASLDYSYLSTSLDTILDTNRFKPFF
ncbi:unnamed protein product [Musa textilis]